MISSDTSITATIDWFSVTAQRIVHHGAFNRDNKDLAKGRLNYNSGMQYTDGRIELWHTERPEMQTHLIMSGETLAGMASAYGMTVLEIVMHYAAGRASRLDIAVDVKGGCLDIGALRDLLATGKTETKAEAGLYMAGLGTTEGETLYVGSSKGERRLRIYDKAREQGFDGEWTRIELQTRQSQARRTIATIIAKGGIEIIPSLINDFANWNTSSEWVNVMGLKKMKPSPGEPPKSNRRLWILDTVAKSIANEIEYGTGKSIIGELLDMVAIEMDVLKSQIKKGKHNE